MNTKQLKYFLATADQGSITAAARELDVAQPAVSLQLANLEHELKTKLFERDFRGVELNDAGRMFEEYARDILDKMDGAKAALLGSKDVYQGKVVVGLSQSCCNVLSIDLLTELEHRFPNIELTFKIALSNSVEKWLSEEKIDIALTFDAPVHSSAVRAIPLIKENLYLYISSQPKNPAYSELAVFGSVEFNDLQHYDIFLPGKQDALCKMLFNQAKKNKIPLKPKPAFGQLMTTLYYVTQGFGLVVLPSSGVFHLESSKQIRAINIVKPKLQREVYLQIASNKSREKAVNVVYELIREITANAHAQNNWRGELLDEKYAQTSVIEVSKFVQE
ncbi:LysR family transcriptional regulator [Glaciecola sp. 2405UD65-10]|uniref:LysR family transcriptional regulator n=1 Tax=Glaciecola sp. 2405UD65-10 TaxID=3397244 RepID=UPI003B5A7C68